MQDSAGLSQFTINYLHHGGYILADFVVFVCEK